MLSLGIGVNGRKNVSLYDASALAFINATGLTGTTEKTAVNNLVKNLKSYGLWSKMKAIYPFVSDTVNLLSYSQDYANAYWSKNTTITSNATTAPDGTNTGVQTSGAGNIYTLSPTLTAQQYSVSVYAKANTATSFELNIGTAGFGLGFKCAFNLSNGTAGTVTNYGGLTGTATITNAGSGWYRCTLSGVLTAVQYYYQLTTNANALYIWGSQLEQASSASTYQRIVTTPANRFVSQFKYNLKDARDLDAAFRLAFNGTWTYSKQGATPNGVNAYANTFFNQQGNWTSTSNGAMGLYLRTNSVGAYCDMGAGTISSGSNSSTIYARFTGDVVFSGLNCTAVTPSSANTNSQGFHAVSRTNSTSYSRYKRGTSTIDLTNTDAIGSNANRTIYLGAGQGITLPENYSNREIAYSFLGDGLTQSEIDLYYTAVNKFQTSLSRQV